MTRTLIDSLADDLAPARGDQARRRLMVGFGLGLAVAVIAVLIALGPRSDLAQAPRTAMFWIKLAYAGTLAGLALACVERLARPAGRTGRRLDALLIPLALMALLAILRLASSPAPQWPRLAMGGSALVCPGYILATSLPVFAGLVWALRGLAPTRLRLCGALAGLAAGGAGAAAYSLHCGESAAPFVALWYSLGVALAGALGALAGERLLRW
jgi:hypothetical protein